MLGYLIGGAVLVEKVYAWPGMGQYALNALLENDCGNCWVVKTTQGSPA